MVSPAGLKKCTHAFLIHVSTSKLQFAMFFLVLLYHDLFFSLSRHGVSLN